MNVRFSDGKNRKKVFVGGLAAGTKESDLRALTQPFGTILHINLLQRRALCGFVTFATGQQAEACIKHLHGNPNADDTKTYTVKFAKTDGDTQCPSGVQRSRSAHTS